MSIISFTFFCNITRHDDEGKGNVGYILLNYTKFYLALKDSSHSLAAKGNDKVLDVFLPLYTVIKHSERMYMLLAGQQGD